MFEIDAARYQWFAKVLKRSSAAVGPMIGPAQGTAASVLALQRLSKKAFLPATHQPLDI
jgi:hypothetical protein